MTPERLSLPRRHAALLKAVDRLFALWIVRGGMPMNRGDFDSMYAQEREALMASPAPAPTKCE